ncbi:DUF1929 domain-containing protein [Kineococcus sp. R8]|uniref:galactose oxidase-like domain-containing protein n=1 Tax=Kineococcus siccus TaxID=2696567 RepID=UPI0014136155|nr:DUF1929 domain-containing protein [Kineococcus siccus]
MKTTRRAPLRRRIRNTALVGATVAGLVVVNGSFVASATSSAVTAYQESRPEYRATHGSWSVVEVPEEFRVNAIHAAMLSTGKMLVIAGSGNDQEQFDAGTFTSILWDPATDTYEEIPTPEDLFCGGHAFLPNGNLLIAGGTRRYEKLEGQVTHAAGPVVLKNESPDSAAVTVPKGAELSTATGLRYRTTEDAVLAPAVKMRMDGETMVHASETEVWAEAVTEGRGSVLPQPTQFTVAGQPSTVYGVADAMTLDKQEYQGLDASYEFDVHQERYVPTGRLQEARWYPTLISVEGGNVLAVSGLDQHGVVLDGQNEVYERSARQWFDKPGLNRYFPTYPALFRLADDRLFYSGSNAGYGSATAGRQPGVWDLHDNSFQPVGGLRDPEMNETSTSVLLPPAQEQQVLIAGGGGVGDSMESTARTDVVDLSRPQPVYTPGPDLPSPTRYLSAAVLPDDTVLTTGGSAKYRGMDDSDLHLAQIYHPDTRTFTAAAAPHVGRDYHSEALLLPDGRVLTLGSDPLYSDAGNSVPGTFEQRLEIYTPPYLHQGGERPVIDSVPDAPVQRGTTFHVGSSDAVTTARLVRPSAVTHVTDTEQRSVALDVTPSAGGYDLTLAPEEGLTPSGWYMLFLLDARGVPSVARWVQVA